MKKATNIVLINIVVLLCYTVIIKILYGTEGSEKGLGILLASMVAILFQMTINIILSIIFFITHDKELGKSFLLSSGIVLLVGFSTCWGSAML